MSQIMYPAITVIIPSYNEENVVASQIEDVQQVLTKSNIIHEIIVVDDGSTDNTAHRVRQTGAKLISHASNRGYGASIKTGIIAAENNIIVITDADKTYPVDQIPAMLNLLEQADMVVGARIGENVHIPWIRRPAKTFLRLLAQRIAEQKIPDLNSGLRIFRSECVKQYFSILSDRFSFTTTVTLAYMADSYRVIYYPINYYSRIGKSKIVPWHFMDFLILILRMSMMFNPLKIFVPLALLSSFLGILKIIYDILALLARSPARDFSIFLQPALSTSAVLLIFVGLQLLMVGMVADGLIRRISQHNRPLVLSHAKGSHVEINKESERRDFLSSDGIVPPKSGLIKNE